LEKEEVKGETVGYRLVPIIEYPATNDTDWLGRPKEIRTAALTHCLITGKCLDGMGGGQIAFSSEVVEWIIANQDLLKEMYDADGNQP
jgi:hypothetical protein